jgi:hypothetical protein
MVPFSLSFFSFLLLQRLHGDFDTQLEELGEISRVLDQLLGTMAPP